MQIDYDKDTEGNIEDLREDEEIRPSKYINNTLIKCEEALASNDTNNIFRFVTLVEHLETVCLTSNLLDAESINTLENLSKKESTKESELYKNANEKLKILLKNVFKNGKSEDPLKA